MVAHLTPRPAGQPVTCRRCRFGTMQSIEREQVFHPPGKTVVLTSSSP